MDTPHCGGTGPPHSPGGQVAHTYTLATLDLRTLDLARSAVDSIVCSAVDLTRSAVDSLVDSASSAIVLAHSAVRTEVARSQAAPRPVPAQCGRRTCLVGRSPTSATYRGRSGFTPIPKLVLAYA